ncbi:MAG: M14 family metallopeptidase, partial [Bacteroidales bacterium]
MSRLLTIAGFVLLILLARAPVPSFGQTLTAGPQDLNTTPSYAETIELCRRLAEVSPMVTYTSFGKSHQLRDLPLIIVDRNGHTTPGEVRASGNIVLLVQAAIHPGEPAGKDAGLRLLRDMVIHNKHQGILEHLTLLFIPIFNVDGHERFGPFNRINQNGPEEMGWRTNALNLNLNRDYLKADSDEMRHWLALWNGWEPDFFIDTHSTNGGDYQYTMTYMLETWGNMDEALTAWCEQVFLPHWEQAMEEGGYPVFPYVSYRNWHDPRSGLVSRPSPPALSTGYTPQRNRPGLLLETHMLKPYPLRVESTYLTILETMKLLNQQHREFKKLVEQADALSASPGFRTKPFPLDFTNSGDSVMVDFLGVEYRQKTSSLSGGQWFIYEKDQPVTYSIPWFNKMVVSREVMLPEAYIIPVEWEEVIRRLQHHGVATQRTGGDLTIEVGSYRFENVRLSASVNEGRQTARFTAIPTTETRTFPAGSVIIEMNQATARVIAHALEPDAPSSFAYWGLFNTIFQRTEYFESYMMENMARQMLEDDP